MRPESALETETLEDEVQSLHADPMGGALQLAALRRPAAVRGLPVLRAQAAARRREPPPGPTPAPVGA